VRNWPLAVLTIRSLRDSGCIVFGELRSALTCVGHSHLCSERVSLTRFGLSNFSKS
jgi:hypothetical protein